MFFLMILIEKFSLAIIYSILAEEHFLQNNWQSISISLKSFHCFGTGPPFQQTFSLSKIIQLKMKEMKIISQFRYIIGKLYVNQCPSYKMS